MHDHFSSTSIFFFTLLHFNLPKSSLLWQYPFLSKRLAHKMRVGISKAVKFYPSGVSGGLAFPADQQLDERPVVLMSRATIQHLHGLGPENSIRVNEGEFRHSNGGESQF
jgi:hypothetical protein